MYEFEYYRPGSLEDAAKMAVAFRYGVDFSAIDYSGKEGLVDVPLLVFQGTDDRTVPLAVNDRFMRIAGKDGTYVVVEGTDHFSVEVLLRQLRGL